jgi:hypothetical protein
MNYLVWWRITVRTRNNYFVVLIVVWAISISACQWATKERFPHPPIYPNAEHISTLKQNNGQVRVTSFEVTDDVSEVMSFYKDALIQQGWELDQVWVDELWAGYRNGAANPAFDLQISVMEIAEHRSKVVLEQSISGPFSWNEP